MPGQIGEVTRITSANMVIEFKPALYPNMRASAYASYEADQNHVTVVHLNGAASGTYKLAVNGHRTAALAFGALAAAVQTALEALPSVGVGNITVTGTGDLTITAAVDLLNEFLVIEIVEDTTDTGVTQTITSQGSKFYRLDAEMSSFSYKGMQESVDVTGLSEKSRRHSPTVSDATFDLKLYEALKDYRAILLEGVEGYLRIFEDGKEVGKRYFAWEVLIKDSSSDAKQFDKIEISMSGRRQGDPIARIGSIWAV